MVHVSCAVLEVVYLDTTVETRKLFISSNQAWTFFQRALPQVNLLKKRSTLNKFQPDSIMSLNWEHGLSFP